MRQDGLFSFETIGKPSWRWTVLKEVKSLCSGIRYFIALRTFGCFTASVNAMAGNLPRKFVTLLQVTKISLCLGSVRCRDCMGFFFEPGLKTTDQDVENRDEDQIQERGRDHTSEDGCADRPAADPACALGQDEREYSEDKRQRGHQNRPQPDERRLHGGLHDAGAFLAELLGEFHNQNGILTGKTDQHDEADLAVHVVILTAKRLSSNRAQQCHRHSQQHNKRKRKAFVLRGER